MPFVILFLSNYMEVVLRTNHALLGVVLSVLLISITSTEAAGNNSLKATSLAQIEVEVQGSDGKKHLERVPVLQAVPGTALIFSTTFENTEKRPASDIVITIPLPENTVYQAGSAYGDDTDITFSLDGGKSFNMPESLKILDADGVEQIAQPDAYTNIRWKYRKQLPAGATGEVGFRVIIRKDL